VKRKTVGCGLKWVKKLGQACGKGQAFTDKEIMPMSVEGVKPLAVISFER
jgi:hypothetical protein